MAKEKSKRSEEELEKRRIARRERYKQLKNDTEKYATEKAKKREAYLKRKSEKKVKSITEMSPREQRVQRKRWRENSKRYLKKKAKEQKMQEVIVSQVHEASEEVVAYDELKDPLNTKNIETEDKGSRMKTLQSKIKALKKKHTTEKREMILLIKKYQHRCRILTNQINKMKRKFQNPEKTGMEDNNSAPTHKTVNSRNDSATKVTKINLKLTASMKRKSYLDLRKKCLSARFQQKIKQGGDSIHKLVEKFYEDDINSRVGAGKKQCVKMHGIQKQKRYLLDSVKNLHKKFCEENQNIRISYVTFSRLRPFWVYLPRDDRETCACMAHTNIDLMISALKKKKIVEIANFQDMLAVICCDKYNIKCVARNCQVCENRVIPYQEFNNNEEIEYHEWCRCKKKVGSSEINIVKKLTRKVKPKDLILKLEQNLPKFLNHTENILNQYQTITQLKETLNTNEAILHMDFSENYNYKFGEEIQSLHFGGSRGQVSLHTVVIYLKEGRETVHYSFCTVSENTRHDSPAVWAHLHKALEFLFEKCPGITTLHILTDSPTSQYRNKQIFYLMTQLCNAFPSLKSVTWNYQEAGHGKGAPDGIGAVIKRTADYQIKCGRDVGNFPTFVEVIRENVKNVEIGVVEEHEILEKQILIPNDISPFKGTMLVHQVIWNSESEFLEFRKLSCFLCINKICEHGRNHMQLHKIYKSVISSAVENVKIIPPNKRIKVLNDITITSSNQYCMPTISGTSKKKKYTRKPVKLLGEVKGDWENQTFIGTAQKVTGHELEFLRFLNEK